MIRLMRSLFLSLSVVVFSAAVTNAQKKLDDPFKGARDADIPEICRRPIEAYYRAEGQYRAGNFKAAATTLDALWKLYPIGEQIWFDSRRAADEMARHANLLFGDPPAYYALRMLDDCVRFRLQAKKQTLNPQTVVLTMLPLGRSTGIQPQNEDEYRSGLGKAVRQTLHPKISADRYQVLLDEVWLLGEYLQAMTNGRLVLKPRVHPMPDCTVKLRAFLSETGRHIEGYVDGEWDRIFPAIPLQVRLETDWWVVIHPLLMNDVPAFAETDICAAGMAIGPDGCSPAFAADDMSRIRRWPETHASGLFTDGERRLFLSQWYQHEFFHHLYRSYPGFHLEVKGHDWHDRKFWPADFCGLHESDYYQESLHKRLQPLGEPPLHVRLKYSNLASPDVMARLTREMVVGEYVRSPNVESSWHEGTMTLDEQKNAKPSLRWKNKANVSWSFVPDFANGLLITREDCPYFKHPNGAYATLNLKHDGGTPCVTGFRFMGEGFVLREPAPITPAEAAAAAGRRVAVEFKAKSVGYNSEGEGFHELGSEEAFENKAWFALRFSKRLMAQLAERNISSLDHYLGKVVVATGVVKETDFGKPGKRYMIYVEDLSRFKARDAKEAKRPNK